MKILSGLDYLSETVYTVDHQQDGQNYGTGQLQKAGNDF